MNNEFKKLSQGNITRYVLESASGGGTSSGSVASVSMPMGGTRKRGDNLIAQEADKNTVPASTPRNFVAKNAKTAGAGAHKDKSKTIPRKEKHKKPYMEDHSTASGGWGHSSYDTYTAGNHGRGVAENPEWYSDEANSMSSSQLKSLYKHAMKLRQTVKQMQAQGDTLEPWQQSKVTKAADYLDAVFNAVDDEHDMGEEQDIEEGWKSALAGATLALGALGGAGHAQAADLSGYNTQYLQQVASGEHPRPMVSMDDAKAELQARANGKQQTVSPDVKPETPSGYSIDYLKKAADPERFGRYLISVEKAQELLKQATAPKARQEIHIAPGDYPAAKEGVAEEWSQKYKSSINCSHPKGFSQKAHCAGKKKHNEDMSVEVVCPDCGMCQTHGDLNEIKKGAKDANGVTKCWPGKHAVGTKTGKNGGQVRNCVPNEDIAEGAKVDRQAKHITASMMKKGKSKKDAENIAWAHIKHPKNESVDPYFESLQQMVERQLEPTMDLDTWNNNFQNADPNKYHQFKNKTPEKKK